MPRKAEGPRPLTTAERVSRHRRAQAARLAELEAENAALRRLVSAYLTPGTVLEGDAPAVAAAIAEESHP